MGEAKRKLLLGHERSYLPLRKAKVAVGFPIYETISGAFFQHFLTIRAWERCNYGTARGAYLAEAHNTLIEQCLELPDWEYLLWIEQDTLPPIDVIDQVELYREPVVAGTYFARKMPPDPIVYDDDGHAIRFITPERMLHMLDNPGLHEVDMVPMGCTAIRRDVLEALDAPWYRSESLNDGSGGMVGDDTYFCRKVRAAGYKIYLNTNLICEHLGLYPFGVREYREWAKVQLEADQRELVESAG